MKILKNFLFNSSYQFLLIILPLATAPYIARVLGTNGIGVNTFTNSLISYFVLIAVLGTSLYGNREVAYYQKDKQKRSDTFWGITFLSWISSAISFSLFFIILQFIPNTYYYALLWQSPLILAQLLDISWYFMGMEKFKLTVARNFIFKILTVICIFTFVHKSSDLDLYIAILSCGNVLSSISLWPYLFQEIEVPNWHRLYLGKHLKGTLSLFIPTIAITIYAIANKTMLGIFDSSTASGFFNQSDTVVRMAIPLVTAMGTVMLPRIASMNSSGKFEEVKQTLVRSFNVMTGISVPLYFGLSGIAVNFATFFYGKPFEVVGSLIFLESPIIIFISWNNVFGVQYLIPLKRTGVFTLSVTVGAIINIFLNFVLIPLFGVKGAVVATLISEFLLTAYQYWFVRKELIFSKLMQGIWKYFLSGLIMFIVVFWMNQTFKMTALQLMLQILVGGFIYVALNILLKTQLWEMAFNLWHQKKNQKVSEMTDDELRLLIPNIQSQFVKEFRIVKKTRESQRDFIRNIDKLEESLDLISKNPAFVRANAIVLAVQLRELSAVFESGSKWMNSNQSYQLVKFSKFLRTLANKIERFSTQNVTLDDVTRILKAEFGD